LLLRYRLLGAIALLTSPFVFAQSALSGFGPPAPTRLNAALGLLFVIGWACSVFALRRARATGRGTAAAVLFAVQSAGLSLAAMQQIQDFIYTSAPPQTAFYTVCNMAWPVSMLLMFVAGIFTVVARVLAGWQRWTPLLCGLGLPAMFALVPVVGWPKASLLFGIYTFAAFGLLAAGVSSLEGSSQIA
jgi:hypothetical protein